MRKHISDKIGLKHDEKRKKINAKRNGPGKNKNAQLLAKMKEIEKKREVQLTIIKKAVQYGIEVKEWLSHQVTIDSRPSHSTNLHKLLLMFEGLPDEDKVGEPFCYVDTNA
jgi:hypothetical protein